ncbi:hypothetical protein GCM10008018_53060 [Paenibacillus marchantiophytorum]|uniref:Uncharacterized protein n=1 Tax=Paenibacillus marchantiophytorum TaxID=1619310 RepID=A0ABQ1F508_9BACL|nr:hypothetical protein [Paenibacillus marchantiophytorum]GGA00148.1 hypothetical protein GCM10008018_53060 [Paenibacillus marchantiophytorum]
MNIQQDYKIATPPLLADYQLENWIHANFSDPRAHSHEDPEWKQLTQYAAYHAIHDWHCLHPQYQTEMTLAAMFERRWTNKVHKFKSSAFYWEVKRIVVANLYKFLSDSDHSDEPFMVFESKSVWVQELESHLSMIVQVMEVTENLFTIHKYMMEPSEAAIELFVHWTIVCSYEAFGKPPEQLLIYHLMSGECQRISTAGCDRQQSIDYLRLVKDVFTDSSMCFCKDCSPGSGRLLM